MNGPELSILNYSAWSFSSYGLIGPFLERVSAAKGARKNNSNMYVYV